MHYFREQTRRSLREYLRSIDVHGLVEQHGAPLMLLDTSIVERQYRALMHELPFLHVHYAVKALSHPAVLETIAALGGSFDIATPGEIDLLQRAGIPLDRAIHTHPIKRPLEILHAYAAGVRMFVVDDHAELTKFAGLPSDTRVLVRLSYPNPHAASDLSSKFGVAPSRAGDLVEHALRLGLDVAGFTMHVGSQSDSASAFRDAVERTLELMDSLERGLGIRFDVLDIGGGLPVAYREEVVSLPEIAAGIRQALGSRIDRLTVIAEPGRFIAAPCATLITSVIGSSERPDGRWLYLDDGVYGSYSNILAEGVHPPVFALREVLDDEPADRRATLAGPTCDSVDVVARREWVPHLEAGDLLVSPMMGAYTMVTATGFNGLPPTKVITVGPKQRAQIFSGGARTVVAQAPVR